MKMLIAVLRIVALLSLIGFIVYSIVHLPEPATSISRILAGTSAGCFLLILLLQLYKHYIASYLNNRDEQDTLTE